MHDLLSALVNDLYKFRNSDVIVEISSPPAQFKLSKMKLNEIPEELDAYLIHDAHNQILIYTNNIQNVEYSSYTSAKNNKYVKTTISYADYDIHLFVKERLF